MSTVEASFSRRVGARVTRIVRCASVADLRPPFPHEAATSLGGMPISCPDIRVLARDCHERGMALLVDNTLASSFGSAPCRRGADVAYEQLWRVMGEKGHALAAVSACATNEWLEGLSPASAEELAMLEAALPAFDSFRRRANDEAQVVANYLRCHPSVRDVRYPGLAGDPSRGIASALLFDGFGPVVDFCLVGDGSWHRFEAKGHDARESIRHLEDRLRA